jgi:hypothetical protein
MCPWRLTPAKPWRHYLAVVQRKPSALRNGVPFAELPDAFRALQQYFLKKPGGDREMVDILALVLLLRDPHADAGRGKGEDRR